MKPLDCGRAFLRGQGLALVHLVPFFSERANSDVTCAFEAIRMLYGYV
jgi:hypothetical protein